MSNYFCKTCGIFTYIGDGENAKDGYRVNLGCVEGLDPLALGIRRHRRQVGAAGGGVALKRRHGVADDL